MNQNVEELITNRYELLDWLSKKVQSKIIDERLNDMFELLLRIDAKVTALMCDEGSPGESEGVPSIDLSQSVSEFMSTRATNALNSKGIFTLQDVLSKTQRRLMQIHGFGKESFYKLRRMLSEHGHHIKK